MIRPWALLDRLRCHPLSRNAGWILGGQVLSFLLQAVFFLLLARFLGVTEYGRFAGAFALVNILMPYSPLGSGMLFMRYVTVEPSAAPVYWANCLAVIAAMSVLTSLGLYILSPILRMTGDLQLVMVLVASNCLFAQIVLCSSTVFQTLDKFRSTAVLRCLPYLLRLAALLAMRPFVPRATALQWSLGVLASTGLSAVVALVCVRAVVGRLRFSSRLVARRLAEGAGYSFAGSTQSAYNDVDKAMLSRFGMNAQNGVYTLAYRILDVASAPSQALDSAALPRYFALNRRGLDAIARLAKRLVPAAALTGAAMGVCALLASAVVPRLAGRDFTEVVAVLRWLALLPMLRGVHQLAGSALTGGGFQRYRTAGQVAVAGLNVAANLWLIPRYGWHGAAWSSLASDGALGGINVGLLMWLVGTKRRSGHPANDELAAPVESMA